MYASPQHALRIQSALIQKLKGLDHICISQRICIPDAADFLDSLQLQLRVPIIVWIGNTLILSLAG